jgi:surface protein
MFSRCKNLFSINLSSFDLSKCQHDNKTSIFQECESLGEITIKKRDLEFFKEELNKSNINRDDIKDLQDNNIIISCTYNSP